MAQFKGMLHLLHKRMANVAYPISKQEIIAPIRQETFSCAAEFYCALLGA